MVGTFSCSGRVINSFAMTYPVAERRFYDPIIEDIEDTFRPGRLGAMNMRRDPEFLWEFTRPRSKLRARLLLVGAGVATGYMLVQSARYPAPEQQLPSLAGEDKAVTSSALVPRSANDDLSTIARAPPAVHMLNAHAPDEAIERESPEPRRSSKSSRPASTYATLRQTFLRKIW